MTDEVRRYLRKAEHALEVAEDLLKDGHVPDVASKTYYACIMEKFVEIREIRGKFGDIILNNGLTCWQSVPRLFQQNVKKEVDANG